MFSGLLGVRAVIWYRELVYGVLCVVRHNYIVWLQQLAHRQEHELYPVAHLESTIYKRVRHVSHLSPHSMRCRAP